MKRPSQSPKGNNPNRTPKPQARTAAAGLPTWATSPRLAVIGLLVAGAVFAPFAIGWDTVAATFRSGGAAALTQCLPIPGHTANVDGAQELGEHAPLLDRMRNGMQRVDAGFKDAVDRCRSDACSDENRHRYIKSVRAYVGEFRHAAKTMDRFGKAGVYLVHDLYREASWTAVAADVRNRIQQEQFRLADWKSDQADIVLLVTKRPDELLPCGY